MLGDTYNAQKKCQHYLSGPSDDGKLPLTMKVNVQVPTNFPRPNFWVLCMYPVYKYCDRKARLGSIIAWHRLIN